MSSLLEEIVIDSLSTSPGEVATGELIIFNDSVAGIPTPEILVEMKGDNIGVSFKPLEEDDLVSTIGSSFFGKQLSYNLGDWKLSNIVHDFTFGEFLDSTDVPLSKIFRKSGAELTKFTPDYVNEIDDYNIIVEVGTNQGGPKAIQGTYSEKKQKYETILRTIISNETLHSGNSKKTLFGIIVAGHHSVATNLALSKDQILELQMRFKVGLKIHKELADLGLIARLPKDATELDKQLEQYFLKLDLLSQSYVDKWNSSIKQQIQSGHVDKEFLKSHLVRWDEDRISSLIKGYDPEIAVDKITKVLRATILSTTNNALNYEYIKEERLKKSIKAHEEFEESYIKQNEGNMTTRQKAMINFPFIVMNTSQPSRIPSNGLVFSEAKFETVYDTLYYSAILKTAVDPSYFPDYESDILEQYNWETPLLDDELELKMFKEENLPTLFKNPGSFSLGNIDDGFIEVAMRLVTDDVKKQEELAKDFKGKTSRFKTYLTDGHRFDLAVKGVQGKGLSEKIIKGKLNRNYNETLKLARENTPDWFHIRDTSTQDMDDLINNIDFYKDITELVPHSTNSVILWLSLINQSRSYHGENFVKGKEEDYCRWLSRLRIFMWCKLISDIGTEVDISLKQNCKKDDFIFKKLQDFNVWLLIKPTKKEDKIFFSVLFKREDINYMKESTVFKKLHKLYGGENFLYTNFISLTESKLLNWVLALPRMIGLMRFWVNFSSIEPYTESGIHNFPETSLEYINFYKNAMPMLMLSVIIGLCDKTEVEEEITRTRYMVMESLSEWPVEPRPYKMAESVSKAMRSRLTLWLYRKHKELCHQYSSNPPRARNDDVSGQGQTETTSQLFWDGFVNPYTGFKLSSGQQVINLFYLGYIKNKDEVAQINKASKLFDKILTYEVQYDAETANIMGITSPENPRPHCFDIDLLIDSCVHLKRRVLNDHPEFDYSFMKSLHTFLFQSSVEEEFSTLKASSNFDENLYDRKKVNEKYQRSKVIEKLALEGEGAVTIAELFEKKYLKALNSRGLNIDIFRKPQHGGDREIYVLGFQERVVQRLIEQVARILCGFIPEETMTHPGNKVAIPENNSREARTKFKTGHLTFNSSADASKWSQNNSSFKMLICLLVMTPSYLHKTIIRCLRLWEFKRIMITPKLLELFDKHHDLLFYDSTVQSMYDGYKGQKYFRWIKTGSPYIEVTTGMMQGILHYSSSLYHSAIISRVKEVVRQNGRRLQDVFHYPKNFKLIMCHLQSSDDSYFSVSAPLNGDPGYARKSRLLATVILQFKADFSTHCGVVNSRKTVLNSNHVFEFNSNFEFGFNHYKPDIKAIFSGFLVSEQELLLTRQEELSVLLTTYLENGGTNYVANGLQIGQSYLHYHLLGLTTTNYFRTYEVLQSILPDPSLGFFLMDNPMCPGLMGFKFNLWNIVKTSNLGKLFKHKLRPITLANEKLEESVKLSIQLSAHGSLSPTYKIVHGNREKWKKLLKKMGLDDSWRADIEKNPEILFRRSLTIEEVKTKISQKMHSPGVSASLSGLNTIPRILAESAYILKLRAITSLSNWIDPRITTFSKVTLIEAILKEMKELLDDGDISDDELKILFPFHDDFTRNQRLLMGVNVTSIGQSFREYKRKETSVEIATNNEYSLLSLKGILLSFWFENNKEIATPRLSKEHRDYIFRQHQKIIPWIRKDINESLSHSPFNEMAEMLLWLNTFSGRRRVVRLLGTQIISRHGHSRLLSVVVNNLSSSHRLSLERVQIEQPVNLISTVRSRFLLLSTLPEFNLKLAEEMLAEYGNNVSFVEGSVKSQQNDVVLMCKLARVIKLGWSQSNSDEILSVINDMKRNKHGVMGVFTLRQKGTTSEKGFQYHGVGIWEGIIDGYDIKIRIFNEIDEPVHVTSVTVNTELAAVESIAIRRFIELMKWTIPQAYRNYKSTLFLNDKGINSNSGVPVFVDPNFNVDITSFFKLRLNLEWTGRNLRCVAQGRLDNNNIRVTVLSIFPKAQHFDLMANFPRNREKGLVERHWLENRSLPVSQAARVIKSFGNYSKAKKDLVRTNLKAKFQNQGVVFKRKIDLVDLAFISKEEETELLRDYLDFQYDFNTEDILVEFDEIDSAPEVIDLEDFEVRNVEELAEGIINELEDQASFSEALRRDIWRLHALFRDFAGEVINAVGRDAINRLIERREYVRDIEGYLEVFEIILDETRDNWNLISPKRLVDLISDSEAGDEEELE